jgi:N-acetylmuramoyl-L-alanine amidase/type II secretory pathway predicted ATPase ExeA
MFLDYYRLREQPFGPAGNPAHLYPSETHCQILERLSEMILGDSGHLALIAESGMGKTTLLQQVLAGLRENSRATFVFQKDCTAREVLESLLVELGVDCNGLETEAMRAKLNQVWFAEMLEGRRLLLIFDNAEDLDESVLETLQFLSRFETSSTRLLQFLLCGQPKLVEKLANEKLTALRKRFAEFRTLEPLTPMETAGYIRHRLKAAGLAGEGLFAPEALALIMDFSAGIPKNINKICARALLEGYARGLPSVSGEIVEKAQCHLTAIAEGTPGAAADDALENLEEREAAAESSPLSYRTGSQQKLTGTALRMGAAVALLLTAGLALPHGMLRGMSHIMGGGTSETTVVNPAQPVANPVAASMSAAVATVPAKPTPVIDAQVQLEARNTAAGQPSLTRELGLKINRIVIDPGHGGFDVGAKGPQGLLEKDLCLDVALRLGQMIEENLPGAEVVYTRKDDSYVPLEERTNIANRADADLFISIHANSSDSSEVRGVETYYLSLASSQEAKELAIRENAMTQSSLHDLPDLVQKITSNEKKQESKQLAEQIQTTLSQGLQLVSRREKNRGVKQAPFIVLTGANMPAVLSEISFLSNASDENLLLQGDQRQRIADGLYRGITGYLEELHVVPPVRQSIASNNRRNGLGSAEPSMAQNGRNPLQQSEKLR